MITFKQVKEEDLQKIENITKRAVDKMMALGLNQWDYTYPTRETFKKDIEEEILYGIYEEDELVGFCAIDETYHEEYRLVNWEYNKNNILYIHRVVVDSEKQGKGYAKTLLKNIINYAKEKNAKALHTDTNHANIAMNAVFKSSGFERKEPDFYLEHKRDAGLFYGYEYVIEDNK